MNPTRLSLIIAAVLACPAFGAPAGAQVKPAEKEADGSRWVFSLLPKSLQKNPHLNLTVITEMTAAGKKLPAVSPASPAYFISKSGGHHDLGHSTGSEPALSPEQIEKILVRALAANGYLPAQPPAHAPSLVINFVWGAHNVLTEADGENAVLSGRAVGRNLVDRAALVGGDKFAKQMVDVFTRAEELARANPPARVDPSGAVPGIAPILGAEQMAFMDPVHQFKLRSEKNEFLVDQAVADVYYVVASAYDHAALARGERRLLWRTRMTVGASGVSEEQTLPTLIATAAPFFGQDMDEPATLTKRAVRDGNVEIGTPTVVSPAAPTPK
jgi:hypothetical protein